MPRHPDSATCLGRHVDFQVEALRRLLPGDCNGSIRGGNRPCRPRQVADLRFNYPRFVPWLDRPHSQHVFGQRRGRAGTPGVRQAGARGLWRAVGRQRLPMPERSGRCRWRSPR